MAEADDGPGPAPPLAVWAVATFNAALLVVSAVGLLYAGGGLGVRLAALDTSTGLLAFLYLWAVTWWTNRRWLAGLGPAGLSGRAGRTDVVVAALRWGAVAGVLVFAPVFVVASAIVGGNAGLDAVPFLLVGAAIGAALSAGVGVVVGGLLAATDLLCAWAGGAWMPVPETDAPLGETDTS